jgi:hypothetical protein
MQLEQVYRQKMTVKVMKIWRIFFYIFISFWLGFQIFVKTLGPFISAYRPLINKRALICDHSQFVDIRLLFGKIFVVKIDAIDFRKLEFNFSKIFYFKF